MRHLPRFLVVFLFGATGAFAQNCDQCLRDAPPNCRLNNDQIFLVEGCVASVTASWDGLTATTRSQSCTATLPPAWMLIEPRVREVSNNNGSYQQSRYSAGTDLEYKKIIDEAYQSALDLAAKIADSTEKAEVEGKLKSEYKSHLEFFEKLKTNMDTVKIEVTASAHGSPIDRKRGWMTVSAALRVVCVAPLDLTDQLKAKYALTGAKVGDVNTVSLVSKAGNPRFVAWRAVDRFTACDARSSGAVSLIKVAANETQDLYIDSSLQVCYSVLANRSAAPKFSTGCRAKFGDRVDLASVSPSCVVN